jgi:hypothetical protein
MKTSILIFLFLLAAVPASACGDGAVAENLAATPAVKAGLADAYRAAHRRSAASRPLSGHTWYGRFGEFEYAVATFDGRQGVFTRHRAKRWLMAFEGGGAVCDPVVPAQLLARVWWWRPARGGCFLEPSKHI